MPELPEVESVRRALAPLILGRRVEHVLIHRADVIDHRAPAAKRADHALLAGGVIAELRRRGKQLALITHDRRALVIHLGMTGQLITLAPGIEPARADHIHLEWLLVAQDSVPRAVSSASEVARHSVPGSVSSNSMVARDSVPGLSSAPSPLRLLFRDPRRFGGVRPFPTIDHLDACWSRELGPDALTITVDDLHATLKDSAQSIKARLLNQAALAGVGNIYADEALFAAGIRPARRSHTLHHAEVKRLASSLRSTLQRAIDQGGSTLRDFLSPTGEPGSYQDNHLVYGRASQPCRACGSTLRSRLIAQRTTVWCSRCQR